MLLEDCYRLLDVEPGVSPDELERAHRDLTKVWHPDRFGHDPALRRKAEEKLKAINEAYQTIRAARPGAWTGRTKERDDRATAGASQPRHQPRVAAIWAVTCAVLAIFFLLRRPTPAGLLIALIVLGVAILIIVRTRRPWRG